MQSGCQQHEPTEASKQNTANRCRNSLRSRREGRQWKDKVVLTILFHFFVYFPFMLLFAPKYRRQFEKGLKTLKA